MKVRAPRLLGLYDGAVVLLEPVKEDDQTCTLQIDTPRPLHPRDDATGSDHGKDNFVICHPGAPSGPSSTPNRLVDHGGSSDHQRLDLWQIWTPSLNGFEAHLTQLLQLAQGAQSFDPQQPASIVTYLLHANHHPTCRFSRPVTYQGSLRDWLAAIYRVWQGIIEDAQPIEAYPVFPLQFNCQVARAP